MNIKLVRLVTGELFIGDVSKNDKNTNIKKPLQVIFTPQQTLIADMLGSISDDDELNIDSKNIVYIINTNSKTTESYMQNLQKLESNIELPTLDEVVNIESLST